MTRYGSSIDIGAERPHSFSSIPRNDCCGKPAPCTPSTPSYYTARQRENRIQKGSWMILVNVLRFSPKPNLSLTTETTEKSSTIFFIHFFASPRVRSSPIKLRISYESPYLHVDLPIVQQ